MPPQHLPRRRLLPADPMLVWPMLLLLPLWLCCRCSPDAPLQLQQQPHQQLPAPEPPDCPQQGSDRRCQVDQRAFEAMSRLHALLDDDKNGAVDAAEADGFAREELAYAADFERTEALNRADPSVSTRELWHHWRSSEAYNWTVEDVCRWADRHAGLPELAGGLREFGIDGPHLPLLTEPAHHPAAAQAVRGLGATQRRRLAIKAIDVVLFGPPKKAHSVLKDALLALFLLITAGGAWLGLVQRHFFDDHRRKVFDQLAHLKAAEKSLADLQQKLSSAERQSESVRVEKLRQEELYKQEICNLKERANQLSHECSRSRAAAAAAAGDSDAGSSGNSWREQLRLAEQEVCQLRALLEESAQLQQLASGAAAGWRPGDCGELQQLMQISYEMELRYCNVNRIKAEEQLMKASDGLDRLKRRQYSVVGLFRNAFNSAELVDLVDQEIVKAKEFADRVKLDIQERVQRWSRIEQLVGFSVVPKSEQSRGDLNIRPYANRWMQKTAAKCRRAATATQSAMLLAKQPSLASMHELARDGLATDCGDGAGPPPTAGQQLQQQLRLLAKRNSVPTFVHSWQLADSKQPFLKELLDKDALKPLSESGQQQVASAAAVPAGSVAVSFCLPPDGSCTAASSPPRMGTHCPSGRHPLAAKKLQQQPQPPPAAGPLLEHADDDDDAAEADGCSSLKSSPAASTSVPSCQQEQGTAALAVVGGGKSSGGGGLKLLRRYLFGRRHGRLRLNGGGEKRK